MAVRRPRIQARPNINRVVNNARNKKPETNSVSVAEPVKKSITEEINNNDKKLEVELTSTVESIEKELIKENRQQELVSAAESVKKAVFEEISNNDKQVEIPSRFTIQSGEKTITKEKISRNDNKSENSPVSFTERVDAFAVEGTKNNKEIEKLITSDVTENKVSAIANTSEDKFVKLDPIDESVEKTSLLNIYLAEDDDVDVNNNDDNEDHSSCNDLSVTAKNHPSNPTNNEKIDEFDTENDHLESTVVRNTNCSENVETVPQTKSLPNRPPLDLLDLSTRNDLILKDLTNDEDLNDELGQYLSSSTKKRNATKVKKEAPNRRKYLKGKEPPDRSKMTLLDLVYWNPEDNPMKSPPKSERTTVDDVNPIDDANTPQDDPDNFNAYDETSQGSAPAPKLKIGPNGEITIDEESLYISPTVPVLSTTVCEATPTTYASFREKRTTCKWDRDDTIVFYRALSIVGTDFSIMEKMLQKRWSRTELKKKYKKEQKMNTTLLDKICRMSGFSDLNLFEKFHETDEKDIVKKELLKDQINKDDRNLDGCMGNISLKEEPVKKKRGRKPKLGGKIQNTAPKTSEEKIDDLEAENEELNSSSENAAAENNLPKKKKRGRKPKILSENVNGVVPSDNLTETFNVAEVENNQPVKKKRGRKKKIRNNSMPNDNQSTDADNNNQPVKKKRGRKPKLLKNDLDENLPIQSKGNKRKRSSKDMDDVSSSLIKIEPRPRRACRKPTYLNEMDSDFDSDEDSVHENPGLTLEQNDQVQDINESLSAVIIPNADEESEAVLSIDGTLQNVVLVSDTGEPIPCDVILNSTSNLEQLDFNTTNTTPIGGDVVLESNSTYLPIAAEDIVESCAASNIHDNSSEQDKHMSAYKADSKNSHESSKKINKSKKRKTIVQPVVNRTRKSRARDIQNRVLMENPIIMDSEEIASYVTVETTKRKKKRKSDDGDEETTPKKRIPKYSDFTITESELSSINHDLISESTVPLFDSNETQTSSLQVHENTLDIQTINSEDNYVIEEQECVTEVNEDTLYAKNNDGLPTSPCLTSETQVSSFLINVLDTVSSCPESYVILQPLNSDVKPEVASECTVASVKPQIVQYFESGTNIDKSNIQHNLQEYNDEFNSQTSSENLTTENPISSMSQINGSYILSHNENSALKNQFKDAKFTKMIDADDVNVQKSISNSENIDILSINEFKKFKDFSLHISTINMLTQELVNNVDKNNSANEQQLQFNNEIVQSRKLLPPSSKPGNDNYKGFNKLTKSNSNGQEIDVTEITTSESLLNGPAFDKQQIQSIIDDTIESIPILVKLETESSMSINDKELAVKTVDAFAIESATESTIGNENVKQTKLKINPKITLSKSIVNEEPEIDNSKNKITNRKYTRFVRKKFKPNIRKGILRSLKRKAEDVMMETINPKIKVPSGDTNDSQNKSNFNNKYEQTTFSYKSADNLACVETEKFSLNSTLKHHSEENNEFSSYLQSHDRNEEILPVRINEHTNSHNLLNEESNFTEEMISQGEFCRDREYNSVSTTPVDASIKTNQNRENNIGYLDCTLFSTNNIYDPNSENNSSTEVQSSVGNTYNSDSDKHCIPNGNAFNADTVHVNDSEVDSYETNSTENELNNDEGNKINFVEETKHISQDYSERFTNSPTNNDSGIKLTPSNGKLRASIEMPNSLNIYENICSSAQLLLQPDDDSEIKEIVHSAITEIINSIVNMELMVVNTDENSKLTSGSFEHSSPVHSVTSDSEQGSEKCCNTEKSEAKPIRTRRNRFKPKVNVTPQKLSKRFTRNGKTRFQGKILSDKLTSILLETVQDKLTEKCIAKEYNATISGIYSKNSKLIDTEASEFQDHKHTLQKIFTFVSSLNPTPERKIRHHSDEDLLSTTNIISSMEDFKSLTYGKLTSSPEMIFCKLIEGTIAIPLTPKTHASESGTSSLSINQLPLFFPAGQNNCKVITEKELPKLISEVYASNGNSVFSDTEIIQISKRVLENSHSIHKIVNSFNTYDSVYGIKNDNKTSLPSIQTS